MIILLILLNWLIGLVGSFFYLKFVYEDYGKITNKDVLFALFSSLTGIAQGLTCLIVWLTDRVDLEEHDSKIFNKLFEKLDKNE